MGRQATLIAYYAETKPEALSDYIAHLQNQLARLGSAFTARSMADIHATVIGLETLGEVTGADEVAALRRMASEAGDGKLWRYFEEATRTKHLSMQFGGFADQDMPVVSRGRRPYDRTLTVSDGNVVLMGWPIDKTGRPDYSLDDVRRGARQHGVTHRYHRSPMDRDPDAYMVIGRLRPSALDTDQFLAEVRLDLSRRPCRVSLTSESLSVASYVDTRLPVVSTHAWPLSDFVDHSAPEA